MYTLEYLAKHVNAELIGDPNCEIKQVAILENAGAGDICFLSSAKYQKYLHKTKAAAVIVASPGTSQYNTNLLIVPDPYVAYAQIAALLYPHAIENKGIHSSAVVSSQCVIDSSAWIGEHSIIQDGAVIGANTYIGPGCIVDSNVKIGSQCRLVSNVTLCHDIVVGDRVVLQPGVVVGSDGFGFANNKGKWLKIPQVGKVIIENDVEVGANTTIDRGTIEDTIIETGVKLDNLIQVAHNVRIGAHTVIAGCTGIAGSAKIGKHCAIGGQVGIVGHLEITDNVQITGKSHVTHSITEPGVYSSGTPLEPTAKWRRNFVRFKQLDDIMQRLKKIEIRLSEK